MNDYQKKYLEQSIMQMSQGELLVLTFDEAIKNLKKANFALEDRNYEKFEEAVQKTNRVVRYLHQTLDMEQPISRDLARLYDFVTFDLGLVQAGRERRQEELPKLVAIMSDLRDGFLGASKIAKSTHMPKEAKVVG
jgi:flagellar protein fliS